MNRTQAVELDNLSLWKELVAEMDKVISGLTEQMIVCEDPAEILRLQEKIKCLRFYTRFPKVIAEREE